MKTTESQSREASTPAQATERNVLPTAVVSANEPPDPQSKTFAVVVYDDNLHSYYDYLEVLMQVFGYSERTAYQYTHAVDVAGRAAVWKGPADQAEDKARRIREHQFEWRRSCAVTAPHRVEPNAPPLRVSVEPVDRCPSTLPPREREYNRRAESSDLERRVLSRIDPGEVRGRPVGEIAQRVTDAIVAAGYRVPAEPSLQAVKNVLGRLFRLAKPAAQPLAVAANAGRPKRVARF